MGEEVEKGGIGLRMWRGGDTCEDVKGREKEGRREKILARGDSKGDVCHSLCTYFCLESLIVFSPLFSLKFLCSIYVL